MNTPVFMRNAERYAVPSKRSAPKPCNAQHPFGAPTLIGGNTTPAVSSEKYSRPSYYPEIAPFSPHFVETTFFRSHTMMEVRKPARLIASPEARIVDPRHASNRLLEEAQSAARRRITRPQLTDKREKVRDERFGRSPMSPATTGGWIANFVDRVR